MTVKPKKMNKPGDDMPFAAQQQAFFKDVGPTVMAILRDRFGVMLSIKDPQNANLDLLEMYHDVLITVWEWLSHSSPSGDLIDDVHAYASIVARKTWSNHVRHKYPNRTLLKNRLCHFLNHDAVFQVESDATGEQWTLMRQAPLAEGSPVRLSTRDPKLVGLIERLPIDIVPKSRFDTLRPSDWRKLLSAVFSQLNGSIKLDDLVAICVVLLDTREARTSTLDDRGVSAAETVTQADNASREPLPAASMLRQLWLRIQQLPLAYRRIYLLSISGPGKNHSDIAVLLSEAVATMNQIEIALTLTDNDYRVIANDIEAGADWFTPHGDQSERFARLWNQLPLTDSTIGRLLGLTPEQVGSERIAALRQLARGFELAQLQSIAPEVDFAPEADFVPLDEERRFTPVDRRRDDTCSPIKPIKSGNAFPGFSPFAIARRSH